MRSSMGLQRGGASTGPQTSYTPRRMDPAVLRLLDANLNRAGDALRVIEDYARFLLNDQSPCHELKELRHELVDATKAFASDAILHRDTAGDVGTGNKTSAELSREDLSHVVIASGKRLG